MMAVSLSALVQCLNNNPFEEVSISKQLIDEIDTSPKEIYEKTGRQFRTLTEYAFNDEDGLFFDDGIRIAFAAKEDA